MKKGTGLRPEIFEFKTAMNTSTLRPFQLDIMEQMRISHEAGYKGIELWMRDIHSYVDDGKVLTDIRKVSDDLGIEILDCISFIKWADRDPAVRQSEMESAKSEMQMLEKIGCKAIAAPPFGDTENNTAEQYGEYFNRLYMLGLNFGIEPILEIWGHRGNIRTVERAGEVLGNSAVENGKVLIDPIHIYKGGGDLRDIAELDGTSIAMVHVNDFPLSVERSQLSDKDRCFPGDGDADLGLFKELLLRAGYRSYLSLELFIEDYGNKGAAEIARRGIDSIYRTFHS
jgi:sugar phosphate isomerase/epimerase